MVEEDEQVTVHEATVEEGRELFRNVCHKELGVEPEEFIEKLRNHEYDCDSLDHSCLIKLVMLRPFWTDDE